MDRNEAVTYLKDLLSLSNELSPESVLLKTPKIATVWATASTLKAKFMSLKAKGKGNCQKTWFNRPIRYGWRCRLQGYMKWLNDNRVFDRCKP